eukprot:TRINITY_DN16641_c0_g1_i1.p1 TRINITY_DN16641_c0_g1~~TRINITY_DN16641_c0_g1_i1.p1  ORF type:complete len:570 (-),score=110.75 TRINITY_DN16641_c0_g1_i1:137-1810(-)
MDAARWFQRRRVRRRPLLLLFVGTACQAQAPSAGDFQTSASAGAFRFLAHPPAFSDDGPRGILSQRYESLYRELRAHDARTEASHEAAFVFLGLDIACDEPGIAAAGDPGAAGGYLLGSGDLCRTSRDARLRSYLETLPGKARPSLDGAPFVLFDMREEVEESTAEDLRRHPGIVIASPGFDVTTYRPGIDVVFPAAPRFAFPNAAALLGASCEPSRWRRLIGYRGVESTLLRRDVAALHDGTEITLESLRGNDARLHGEALLEFLRATKFALIPRGIAGQSSRAAVEAACAGAVPVFLNDLRVPPFSEPGGVDYASFSLTVDEERWHELPAMLRSFGDEAVCRMQRAARLACFKHFASEESQVETLLSILARRLRKQLPRDIDLQFALNDSSTPPSEAPEAASNGRLAALEPTWETGPFLTFGCGEVIRARGGQRASQECRRCLVGTDRSLPRCASADRVLERPASPSGTELDVGQPCVQYGGEYDGCACVQGGTAVSRDFTQWQLSPSCDVRDIERWFDCSSGPGVVSSSKDDEETCRRDPPLFCRSSGQPVLCS